MLPTYIPAFFSSLTIAQLEYIEDRCIMSNDNTMRFMLLRAAKGNQQAQREVMTVIKNDPTWLEFKSQSA